MDFTRKVKWVLDGHKTPDRVESTYADVIGPLSSPFTVVLNDSLTDHAVQHHYDTPTSKDRKCFRQHPHVPNIGG
eukprot:6829857-Ditylum_brightwellii.AAC.1